MTESDRKSFESMRAATDPYSLHEPEPLPEADDSSNAASTRGRALRAGVRTVTAITGIALAILVIAATTVFSGPRVVTRQLGTIVTPVPAAQQRVCPGPIQAVSDDAGAVFSPVGAATENYRAVGGTVFSDRLVSAAEAPNAGPLRLTLPPRAENSSLLAGSQAQLLNGKALSGFAAAECAQPSGESWLVGGSTDVGRSSVLLIANPSTVPATVTIEIYGESGKVTAPGMAGLIVAPATARGFSLAGFAPGLISPVVHVSSRGGQVVATLQQSTVRTLQPGGVDLVGPVQMPNRTATIPGLVVSNGAAVTAAQGVAGFEDLETAVRLIAPGARDATATVTITAESSASGGIAAAAVPPSSNDGAAAPGNDAATGNGGVSGNDAATGNTVPGNDGAAGNDDAPGNDTGVGPGANEPPSGSSSTGTGGTATSVAGQIRFTVSLIAGRVTEIPLPGLADGSYVVTVVASEPVVAAARTSVVGANAASDFEWLASAARLGGRQLVSVAAGPLPTLHLANSDSRSRTVTITDGTSQRQLEVPARGGSSLPLVANSSVLVTGATGLVAGVNFLGDAQIAGFSVTPPDAGSQAITVYR